MTHHGLAKLHARRTPPHPRRQAPVSPTFKHAVAIGWSGMRGIVTLAAAMALPASFPFGEFIQLAAFAVVLGTLVIQGLTLGPLVRLLNFPKDNTLEREVKLAREASLWAARQKLENEGSVSAERLRAEYEAALHQVKAGKPAMVPPDRSGPGFCAACASPAPRRLKTQVFSSFRTTP